MIVIGLTGNYGMGKSTAARMFKELGAVVIDTDEMVRELLDDPAVINEIKNTLGEDIADGGVINKKMLANAVFEHPHLRISLEDILHPKVFKKIEEELNKISNTSSVVIIEAPVIFERGYQNRFDKIVTVFTSEDIAISRLREKGVTEHEARRRLKNQFPVEMKVTRSDFVVDNNGSMEDTRKQVFNIYQELLSEIRRHGNN